MPSLGKRRAGGLLSGVHVSVGRRGSKKQRVTLNPTSAQAAHEQAALREHLSGVCIHLLYYQV